MSQAKPPTRSFADLNPSSKAIAVEQAQLDAERQALRRLAERGLQALRAGNLKKLDDVLAAKNAISPSSGGISPEKQIERHLEASPPAYAEIWTILDERCRALQLESLFQPRNLAEEAVAPAWFCSNWLLKGAVNVLYGPGGSGKSLIAAALALATTDATQKRPWLQHEREQGARLDVQGPVHTVYLTWEDPVPTILHRMLQMLEEAPHKAHQKHLHLVPMSGLDSPEALFAPAVKSSQHIANIPQITPLGERVLTLTEKHSAGLLIIDTAARSFMSDENNRAFVSAYLGYLDAWAQRTACTVLLLAHTNKIGHLSGSTSWANSARLCIGLTPPWEKKTSAGSGRSSSSPTADDSTTTMAITKSNHGPQDTLFLRYTGNGYLLTESSLPHLQEEPDEDEFAGAES